MLLDGCRFLYGNFDSRAYGLLFAHCDTKPYNALHGDIEVHTAFHKKKRMRSLVGDDYGDSALAFDAEVVTDDMTPLSAEDARAVEKALFCQANFCRLYWVFSDVGLVSTDETTGRSYETIDGELKRLYLNCRFTNPEKIEDVCGLPTGYRFTVFCDSHLAWQDELVKTFSPLGGGGVQQIEVQADTDMTGYTYPTVRVVMGASGGDLTIVNTTDAADRLTKFENLSGGITLVMNGGLNLVSGDNYGKFVHKNFVRLLDGTNAFTILGDVDSVSFRWNNRRFL